MSVWLLSFVAIVVMAAPLSATAADVERQCLRSFAVADRGVDVGNATVSCLLLEGARNEMLARIDSLASDSGIESLRTEIIGLETQLAAAEEAGGSAVLDLLIASMKRFSALLSIAECKASKVCYFRHFVVLLSETVETVRNSKDLAERRNAVARLRSELIRARERLTERTDNLAAATARLAAKFNEMCEVVQDRCLEMQPGGRNDGYSK